MPKDLVRNEERWKESRMDRSFSDEGSQQSRAFDLVDVFSKPSIKRHDENASKPKQTQER